MNLDPSSALVSGLQLFSSQLNQSSTGTSQNHVSVGDRIPVVYGRNVYIPDATVLSHRIDVSADRKRLVHYLVCLISLGQISGFETGEIVELEKAVYSHGVRVGRSQEDTPTPIFLDWRSGLSSQEDYVNYPNRAYSYKIHSNEVTIPTTFTNGVPITNGNIFWQSPDGLWNGKSIRAGDSVGINGWTEWISITTNESTSYPSISTALVEQQSLDGDISSVDFVVKKGRSVQRIDYVKGSGNELNQQFSKGNSDRYPDVVYDILRQSVFRADQLVDFESFHRANLHVDKEGLGFGGSIQNFHTAFSFVNSSSLFFDLIPVTTDSRIGFVTNKVETIIPRRLFTGTNQREFTYEYLDSYLHRISSISEVVIDPFSKEYKGVVTNKAINEAASGLLYSPIGSVSISAEQLMSDRSAISSQAARIMASINSQDEQVTFVADSLANTIEPGDFILAHDASIAVGRVYVGGISRKATGENVKNVQNLYLATHPSSVVPTVLEDGVTNNKILLTTQFRIELAVGDFIVFNIFEQSKSGSMERSERVIGKVVSSTLESSSSDIQKISAQLIKQRWEIEEGRWVDDDGMIIAPANTEAYIYRLSTATDFAIVDDYKGVYKARAEVMIAPVSEGTLETCIRFIGHSPNITEPVPVLISPESDLSVWRVSSIEPLVGKGNNIEYRVCATIYDGFDARLMIEERGVEKDYTGVKPVPSIAITKRDLDYLGYSFTYLGVEIIDSTKRFPDLEPVNVGNFRARAVGSTEPYTIAPVGSNETNQADRKIIDAVEISRKYQSAIVRIDMRSGEHATGFIISSDGTILTNEHVASKAVRVVLFDGSVIMPKWYKLDEGNDIAVGKLLDSREFNYCEISPKSGLSINERVYAIGNSVPDFFKLTTSIVEQYGEKCTPNGTVSCYRADDGLLEGGGSGSPIFNQIGLVVGMARAIAITTAGAKDYFMEINPIINRIFNEKLWLPPVGQYNIPSPIHTERTGYTRQELVSIFTGSAVSIDPMDRIYRDNPEKITKWPKRKLTLSISGIYSVTDKQNFSRYISEMNAVLPPGISIEANYIEIGRIVTTSDMYAYIIPRTQFEELTSSYSLDYPSYSYADTDGNGTIVNGYIIVPFDGITDIRRARLFARELYRTMGFVGSILGSSNSVLDDSGLEQEPVANDLANIDEQALKLLYRPEFLPGMAAGLASSKLNRIQEI